MSASPLSWRKLPWCMFANALTSTMYKSYGHVAHGHTSLAIRMVILFLCISPGYLPQGHIYPALLIFTLNTDILIFNIPRVYNVLPYLLCAVISDILPGLIYFGRISRELCFWTYFVGMFHGHSLYGHVHREVSPRA